MIHMIQHLPFDPFKPSITLQFHDNTVYQIYFSLTICLGHLQLCRATTTFLSAS